MACFKRVKTPSHGCRGKAKAYFGSPQGLMKKSLSEGANCWHTLPVLKGKFYSQEPLDSADASSEAKSPKKGDDKGKFGLTPLHDEAMTSYVLDEIYPKSPGSRAHARTESDWPSDLLSMSPASPSRSPSRRRHKSCFGAKMVDFSGPPAAGGAESSRGTRSLALLVHLRKMLSGTYSSLKEGMESFMNEFPSTKSMTRKEFQRILQTRMGYNLDNKVRDGMFDLMDLDGDGTVSLGEFQMAIEAAAPVGSLIQLRRRWLA